MPTKQAGGGAVTLNDRLHCEAKVAERTKLYDKDVKGLYLSVTTSGEASFWFKYTNPVTKKREQLRAGKYVAGVFGVDEARIKARGWKNQLDLRQDIGAQARQQQQQAHNLAAKTVAEVIDEYVAWISENLEDDPTKRERPRRKAWATTAQYLNRYARLHLGTMIASEVTSDDIAALQEGLRTGKLCISGKPSKANARHVRVGLSKMFKWAAQSPHRYVNGNPCINLPELEKSAPRTRKLTVDEIRTLWLGLDRPDLPCHPATALALKLVLVTMARSGELRGAEKNELERHVKTPVLHVPWWRVKGNRDLYVPLTGLALEILKQANKRAHNSAYLFTADGEKPLAKTTLSQALRGVTYKGQVKQLGICEWLGMEPFRPHDLRRTAAHLAKEMAKQSTASIALCLDHQSKEDGHKVADEHYLQTEYLPEKVEVLEAWESLLKDIIAGKVKHSPKVVPLNLDLLAA